MRINDYLDHAILAARETKEQACRERPADICPYVSAYRGDELISIITLRHQVAAEVLTVATISAVGFDADVISMVVETYIADTASNDPAAGINPHTGRPWQPGEMQDVAENHDGIEKGWVTEALVVTVANRAGDVGVINQPYRFSGKHLVWVDNHLRPKVFEEGNKNHGGIIPDALRRAMQRKSTSQVFSEFVESKVIDHADLDILTAEALGERFECAVMLGADIDDDVRVRKLKEVGVVIPPGGPE